MKRLVKLGIFLSAFLFFFGVSAQINVQDSGSIVLSIEAIESAHAETKIDSMFKTLSTEGGSVLNWLCKALNGYMGWMIILFGAVLGAWEYFVQRQGHLLVAIIIGIVAIIFIGKILKKSRPNNSC